MKVSKLHSVLALGMVTLTGGLLSQLIAQSPQTPTSQVTPIPGLFKDYQTGINEARWTGKPLFVIFRCER